MAGGINVYIWGTGQKAGQYLARNEIKDGQLLGFIQSRKTEGMHRGKKVFEPQEVVLGEREYILVCVMSASREIYGACVQCGIPVERVIFMDNFEWPDQSPVKEIPEACYRKIVSGQDDGWIRENLPEFYSMLEDRERALAGLVMTTRTGCDADDPGNLLGKDGFRSWSYRSDYCRFRTFELMADEIRRRNTGGETAELGVYKGTFARLINAKFPDKKIYLFDTFRSFDQDEYREELERERCRDGFIDVFKDTSVEKVTGDMPFPEQCIPRVGLFPGTADGLEEIRYAFVSIDVDFEKSIYEGLKYFYPRLNRGGAIFVHDYNNCFLHGVKRAVERYEKSVNETLAMVPIADGGGTLVILK